MQCAHLGGIRLLNNNSGALDLLSRVWASGTNVFNEFEINHFMEERASQISAFTGRHTVGLSMNTLSFYFSEMLPLYIDILTVPVVSEAIFQREKLMLLEGIKVLDSLAQVCF